MLVGVVAYNVLTVIPLDQPRALGILLTAYAFQGQLSEKFHHVRRFDPDSP